MNGSQRAGTRGMLHLDHAHIYTKPDVGSVYIMVCT